MEVTVIFLYLFFGRIVAKFVIAFIHVSHVFHVSCSMFILSKHSRTYKTIASIVCSFGLLVLPKTTATLHRLLNRRGWPSTDFIFAASFELRSVAISLLSVPPLSPLISHCFCCFLLHLASKIVYNRIFSRMADKHARIKVEVPFLYCCDFSHSVHVPHVHWNIATL